MNLPFLPRLNVSGWHMFRMSCHLSAALWASLGIITLKVREGRKESRGPLGSHKKEQLRRAVPGSEKQGRVGADGGAQRASGGPSRGVVGGVKAAQGLWGPKEVSRRFESTCVPGLQLHGLPVTASGHRRSKWGQEGRRYRADVDDDPLLRCRLTLPPGRRVTFIVKYIIPTLPQSVYGTFQSLPRVPLLRASSPRQLWTTLLFHRR